MAVRIKPPVSIMMKRHFNIKQVKELIEEIKNFDAGAVDDYLSDHIESIFDKWIEKNND